MHVLMLPAMVVAMLHASRRVRPRPPSSHSVPTTSGRARLGRKATPPELPVFVTEDNRARLMAIYEDTLSRWPVRYEAFFIRARYGRTHVIGSGDPGAPPVVMTHPFGVGGFVWSSIIETVGAHRHAYALDTIGDVGRSELVDPDKYPKTSQGLQRVAR